ncbi:MAG: gliding motility-associated C-terminal domain-containing protein, partial [Cyclobacteriaceae bacterium]|nr:gliding motility-associated C-terminal domain-containing protein [Cyclobacteriaceae bacterium]
PFVNSTPQLFPPLNDYACPYRPYWVDFAGKDLDGDSLVYQLVNPLSTQFNSALPPNGQNLPAPYNTVVWRAPFSLSNILNGIPDMSISDDGFLSLTPKSQGLFVFAVKVDEYRNGIKIGQVRRDFQLLVVDKCPKAEPPLVSGKKLADADFTYTNTMSVTFNQSIADEERCIQIQVSDEESLLLTENFSEKIKVKAIPLNFKGDISEVLPDIVFTTLTNGSTFNFDVCFPECPYLEEGPFEVGIVAFDDACTLPLSDTLRITVNVQPPPNNEPYFANGNEIYIEVNEKKDGFYSTDIVGLDLDPDQLFIDIFPMDFVPEEFGMSFNTYLNEPGQIKTRFDWNYDCIQTSFDKKTYFETILVLDDMDQCLFAHPDTLKLIAKINLPPNTFPDIYSEDLGTKTDNYFRIEQEITKSIDFNVFAEDFDNDLIKIIGEGADFSLDQYNVQFPEKQGTGNPGIGNNFHWDLSCDLFNLDQQDSFRFYLMVEDFDYCNITSRDTLTVDIIVNEKLNTFPDVTFTSMNTFTTISGNEGYVNVNDPVNIEVALKDIQAGFLTLELKAVQVNGQDVLQDIQFDDVSGIKDIASNLIWNPDCKAIDYLEPQTKYTFIFYGTDEDCKTFLEEPILFYLTIRDTKPPTPQYDIPNVFTPNGDKTNDFFAIEWTGIDGKTYYTLPEDNCANSFQEIKIFNRWGREVFQSDDRRFKWEGGGYPAGVYYYYIQFTESEHKGIISMLY